MILWVVLVILVAALSYVLALKSMKDFTEISSENHLYSLYLIRRKTGLDENFFRLLDDELSQSNVSISFERLFKGSEAALVVFGPREFLEKFKTTLDLLELEDYTNVNKSEVAVWEIGIKNAHKKYPIKSAKSIPLLAKEEKLWWQLILWRSFHFQIRCMVISADSSKRKNLSQILPNLPATWLTKLPKEFSNNQLLEFYQNRSFQRNIKKQTLNAGQIQNLLWI